MIDPINEKISEIIGVKRDYTNCLNACHEMERSLPTILETAEYQDHLRRITAKNGNPVWFADTSQRCESFLLTCWRDVASNLGMVDSNVAPISTQKKNA